MARPRQEAARSTEADEILTLKDALKLLKMSRSTLHRRMADGSIPYRRIGKSLRFSRNAILRRIAEAQSA